jgi:voltage-gated sodium channel
MHSTIAREKKDRQPGLPRWCRQLAADGRFQGAVLLVILANALIMGLETSRVLVDSYRGLFELSHYAVQVIFVVEVSIRLLAYWPRLAGFFRGGWNVFDFGVVVASLLPMIGPLATIARLARILRIARLLSAVSELRLIVGTMLRSIPSMANVLLLLALLMYVYGVLGYSLFHEADPRHWGSLALSLKTLFQILTLEGWVEVQEASLAAYPWAWLYYASFILIAVFVVINLFIAVVINNLEAARKDHQPSASHSEETPGTR